MPQLRLIDTHAHLDCEDFVHDLPQVLRHSQAMGVERFLLPGVTAQGWPRLWQLAQQEAALYAAPGLHPLFLSQHRPEHLHQLGTWLEQHRQHPKVCALGEIGLDYFVPDADRAAQQALVEAQLQLAIDYQLPVLLHVRRAHAPMIATLKRYPIVRGGIVHAFTGSLEEAKEYQKLGFLVGLGGAGTWPQALRLHRLLARLPLESVALETDAPDIPSVYQEGPRNSPEFLPQICTNLAQRMGVTAEELAAAAYQNTCRLFGWS